MFPEPVPAAVAAPRYAARPIVTGDDGVRGASGRPRGARARLGELTLRDEHRLAPPARPRCAGARRAADARAPGRRDRGGRGARRAPPRGRCPQITYPPQLPVSARRDDLLAAIRDHQVVVVAGETGSGKTTQLPKLCLELGRGVRGAIAHTQPRRLAARTVAERIAEELGVPLGEAVGYAVRFNDRSREDTLVRLMTDGLLLAEIQHDRLLRRYDTIIVDEAHERSLNIDFLLGYLKRASCPQRPDLKLVITSATIDPERFSRHFGDAPVVEVSGRTYPVEVRYRAARATTTRPGRRDRRRRRASCCARGPATCSSSSPASARSATPPRRSRGRLRAERRAAAALRAPVARPSSSASSSRTRRRRVVLATNVAETSLTVPGIRYVVDPGTARISRYSARLKVQRLPIEPVSQASADQRKGRCGRTSDGICIRLYSEEDFEARPRFTDPEILRTSLAAVILQMAARGPRRGRGLPVPRPARPPPGARRRRAAARARRAGPERDRPGAPDAARAPPRAAAGRPAPRAHGARGRPPRLRRRGHRDRRRAVDPGPARAARRPARGQADQLHARFGDEASDFLALARTSGATCASSSARCRAARSGAAAGPSSCTTCASASGRTSSASCARRPRAPA